MFGDIDATSVGATIAVTLAAIGGIGGAYAALRQRRTEDVGQVLTAQSQHMGTLSTENQDLRNRLTSAEEQVRRLREEVWNCDRDKERLKVRVEELERRFDSGGIN